MEKSRLSFEMLSLSGNLSSVSGHPVLLLPVTKKEPESLSSDDTDVSDSHVDGVSPLTPALPSPSLPP